MQLSPPQLEAVSHKTGPLLIFAGAGSGKTTVLVERIIRMIQSGSHPSQFLCVTFTNKAVNEIRSRISSRLREEEATSIHISTFHSLGLYLLREKYQLDFSVAGTHKARQILKSIVENLPAHSDAAKNLLKPNTLGRIISLFKAELVTPEFLEKGETLKEWIDGDRVKDILRTEVQTSENFSVIKKVYRLYQEQLAVEKLIDVDDILLLAVQSLIKQSSILNELQEQFLYLSIDEYQDTNRAQYALVRILSEKHQNIVAVGDDFQSIYRFRGSDMRNILKFRSDYPLSKEIMLEENFRSSQIIVQAANEIISHNTSQKEKTLFTSKEKGHPITGHRSINTLNEAEYVADQIAALIRSGNYQYKDIAVFYRNNSDSSHLETVFPAKNIPYVVSSESSFFERKEIKDILWYLQFILNSSDSFLFNQVVNNPKRGIGNTTIQKIIQKNKGTDFLDTCQNLQEVKVNKHAATGLLFFTKLISSYQEKAQTVSSFELIQSLLIDLDYRSSFEGLEFYLKKEKEDYLQKLLQLAKEMELENGAPLLIDAFLKKLLQTDVDAMMTEEHFNRVQLLTIHASKGLEFPVVFIINMKEEGFPSKYAQDHASIEEERRLCFVAFTRAKSRLFVTYPSTSIMKLSDGNEGETIQNQPSRFLSEFSQVLMKWE